MIDNLNHVDNAIIESRSPVAFWGHDTGSEEEYRHIIWKHCIVGKRVTDVSALRPYQKLLINTTQFIITITVIIGLVGVWAISLFA